MRSFLLPTTSSFSRSVRMLAGWLVAMALVAVGCSSTADVSRPEAADAQPARSERGDLPVESGEVVLADEICAAAELLVAADRDAQYGGESSLVLRDAAATEWEIRLHGLRHAAAVDPAVTLEDATVVHLSTLHLGLIDRRSRFDEHLPPTDFLRAEAQGLREVMVRLCPAEWADEIATRVIVEWTD